MSEESLLERCPFWRGVRVGEITMMTSLLSLQSIFDYFVLSDAFINVVLKTNILTCSGIGINVCVTVDG